MVDAKLAILASEVAQPRRLCSGRTAAAQSAAVLAESKNVNVTNGRGLALTLLLSQRQGAVKKGIILGIIFNFEG